MIDAEEIKRQLKSAIDTGFETGHHLGNNTPNREAYEKASLVLVKLRAMRDLVERGDTIPALSVIETIDFAYEVTEALR